MEEYTGVERRRSFRINDGIKAKIVGRIIKRPIPVINISQHGALLRSYTISRLGRMLDLLFYLPEDRGILSVKARVARVVTICSAWGFHRFDIGIEFLGLLPAEEKKLEKVISYLLEKNKTI